MDCWQTYSTQHEVWATTLAWKLLREHCSGAMKSHLLSSVQKHHVALQEGFTCRAAVSKAFIKPEYNRHTALSLSHVRKQTHPIPTSATSLSLSFSPPSLCLSGGGIVNQIKILSCTNDILPKRWNNKGWENHDLILYTWSCRENSACCLLRSYMSISCINTCWNNCMCVAACASVF